MATIQQTIAKAASHLGDLTLSQRLAIGLGALLVVVSVIWLAQWAATPEMAPLLPGQDLSPEELALATSGLDAMNEPHRVEGSQILVRASANRQALIASLQQTEKLPTDMAIGFAELVKEANPWISQSENDKRWTVALQSELARVLQQFSGVKQAFVVLNLNTKKGFARTQPESTASVTLFTSGSEPVSRSLALATARMVAGAVSGLPVKNVQVIDGANNRVALDWDTEEGDSATSLHQQRRRIEREKELQIKEQLGFDHHVLVSVSADLNWSASQEQEDTVTEGTAVKEQTDTTNTVRSHRSGVPGAQSNVGIVAGGGGGADTSTSERSETAYEPSRRSRASQTPAGVPKSMAAAVSLSYSYLRSVFELNNPGAEAPTEAQIESDVFAKQKQRVITQVAKLLIPPDEEQVSVVWHYDTIAPERVVVASTLDSSLDVARKYGPASGLGLLAILSLAMMMRLAKRQDSGESFGMEIGLPKEAIDAAKRAAEGLESAARRRGAAGAAGSGAGTAGRAASAIPILMSDGSEGILDAQEVPESEVQIKQMLEQVAQMTEADSDAVASLVENWIDFTNR